MRDSHRLELGRSLVVLFNLENKLSDICEGATDTHREMWLVAPALEAIQDCLDNVRDLRKRCEQEKEESEEIPIHPLNCGCTDCCVGESRPMTEKEHKEKYGDSWSRQKKSSLTSKKGDKT
jgi:hypothetical protein